MQVPVEAVDWRLEEKPHSNFGGGSLASHRTVGDFCNFLDFGTDVVETVRINEDTLTIQDTTSPFRDDEKLNERIKSEPTFVRSSSFANYSTGSGEGMERTKDLFDMSSFFRDHENFLSNPTRASTASNPDILGNTNRTAAHGSSSTPNTSDHSHNGGSNGDSGGYCSQSQSHNQSNNLKSRETDICCEGHFEDLMHPHTSGLNEDLTQAAQPPPPPPLSLNEHQSSGSTETNAENLLEGDTSVDSVVMGIPYYVACQWQQMQQQQQQQQQAVMMLWWQAYLSGAYTMMGPKSMTAASGQLGCWSFPHTTSVTFPGTYSNPLGSGRNEMMEGDESLYHHMMMIEDNPSTIQSKRRRRMDGMGLNGSDGTQTNGSKKGRRSRQNERICKNCGTNATPFWRKDKQDGRPLCNACGLYLSKNDTPRPKVLWKYSERSPVVIV